VKLSTYKSIEIQFPDKLLTTSLFLNKNNNTWKCNTIVTTQASINQHKTYTTIYGHKTPDSWSNSVKS